MADAYVTFEREGREGIVAVGSYLGDVIGRFGIADRDECTTEHDCVVTIKSGEEFLSKPTSVETEHFSGSGRKSGERLACHAKIERPGEIVVMTQEKKKKEEKTAESTSDQFRKEFEELPLEQKIAELMKLEAIAFGDTVSYIANSPFKVFEKIGDVMADFGMKLENKAKSAQRPEEHTKSDEPKAKSSGKKKSTKSEEKKSDEKKTQDN